MKLTNGSPEAVGMSAERIAQAEALAEGMIERGITSAHVVLAARKGVIVTHKAWGKLTPKPDAPEIGTDTLYPLCSITKVITAACIMILVEKGLIGLNRPVIDYIPEFTGKHKEDVRLYHLLTHTSGLRYDELYKYKEQYGSSIEVPPCDDNQEPHMHEQLHKSYGAPLWKKPGKVMCYCGFNYELLGEIIRRTTGLGYPEFVRKHLFEPLGMNDSYFQVPASEKHRVVRREPGDPCAEWLEQESCMDSVSAAAGMYSTAMDLGIFAQMFLNQGTYNGVRILSPISVAEMTRNHLPGISSEYRDEVFPEAYWGYGWGINGTKKDGGDLFSPAAYSHWGAAGVFVAVDPVYDIFIIHFSVEKDLQKPFKNMYTDHLNNAYMAAIEEI